MYSLLVCIIVEQLSLVCFHSNVVSKELQEMIVTILQNANTVLKRPPPVVAPVAMAPAPPPPSAAKPQPQPINAAAAGLPTLPPAVAATAQNAAAAAAHVSDVICHQSRLKVVCGLMYRSA